MVGTRQQKTNLIMRKAVRKVSHVISERISPRRRMPRTSRQTGEVPGVEEGLNQRVKEILAKGVTHPLKAEIVEKLDGIMARAEAEL